MSDYKYLYQRVVPATIIYHSPDDLERIETLSTENNNLRYKNEKLDEEVTKAKQANKIRYEQLKKKYDTLSKLYGKVLKRLNEIKMYAPGFGSEYQTMTIETIPKEKMGSGITTHLHDYFVNLKQ